MVHFNFDILSLIFIEALHTDSTSLLTLRLVNRTWYEITGRTPQLWTRLVLRRRSHFTDLKYAQLYLRKSGTLPIDIHITLPDDVDVSEIEGVSDLLRGQISRFRSFDLHVRIRDELEEFIFFIAKDRPAPLLESLELRVQRCTPCDTVVCFVSLLDAFTPAPHLTHIEIPGWPFLETFPQLPNITSLTIDSMSLDSITIHEIIVFLCSTPSLEHFVYKGHGISDNTVRLRHLNDPRVVHLPNLVTVDVTAPGSGGDVLCLINAPALRDARLDGFRPHNFDVPWEGPPNESLTQIVFLLPTHSRNLRCLTLEYTEFLETPGGFETIFDDISFPQLEEILLIATDITDEALMKGARRNLGLKRLELRYCDGVTGTGFLEFVQRRGSDFSLSLQYCGNLNKTQEDMEAISEMIKVEGLH
jgi:F-box-like